MARFLEAGLAVLTLGTIALVKLDLADDAARLLSPAEPQGYMNSRSPWSEDYVPAPPGKLSYYRNCDEARGAGAAPVRRGELGYGSHLDRDGDGVACEPYRGR